MKWAELLHVNCVQTASRNYYWYTESENLSPDLRQAS